MINSAASALLRAGSAALSLGYSVAGEAGLASPLDDTRFVRAKGAMYMTEIQPVLEPAAQDFADATAKPPQLYDLPVDQGRKIVDQTQDGDIRLRRSISPT
jgi:hypothetical protein